MRRCESGGVIAYVTLQRAPGGIWEDTSRHIIRAVIR